MQRLRSEARAFQPQLEEIGVVAGRFALAQSERVEKRKHKRDQRRDRGVQEAPAPNTEKQKQRHNSGERSTGHKPDEITFQSPRLPAESSALFVSVNRSS